MVLRRRFEEGRSRFADQLDHWGEAWEAWKTEVSERANETQDVLQTHLINAEMRIDAALADLRAKRNAWQQAIRDNQSPHYIRHLRRTMRKGQHAIKASLNEWEQLMQQYALTMAPAGA